jgi:hypothetical protein
MGLRGSFCNKDGLYWSIQSPIFLIILGLLCGHVSALFAIRIGFNDRFGRSLWAYLRVFCNTNGL